MRKVHRPDQRIRLGSIKWVHIGAHVDFQKFQPLSESEARSRLYQLRIHTPDTYLCAALDSIKDEADAELFKDCRNRQERRELQRKSKLWRR